MAFASIIKYEGDNSTFVWKHPDEDFNTDSQLIVHESQEAIFFLNGQATDLFGSGRYTLETANIPILRSIMNLSTGGATPFHCEVYFVNKAEQMAIKWGTDSKIQYIEPTYGFPLEIGASGEMSLRAEDSKKLLVNLVGTEKDLSREKLVSYFRAFLMTRVKSYIAQIMRSSAINIFEIDEHLVEFSDELKERLVPDFKEYGISLERFFITGIAKPDGKHEYETFKELHFRQYADVKKIELDKKMSLLRAQAEAEKAEIEKKTTVTRAQAEAEKTVITSKAMAQKRAMEGYTYQQERGFNVAHDIANNEAVAKFTNLGLGIGTMAGVGGTLGGLVGGALSGAISSISQQQPAQPQEVVPSGAGFCENCGAPLTLGAAFCDQCGTPIPQKNACPKCGYVFERPGKFCPKCGMKREA